MLVVPEKSKNTIHSVTELLCRYHLVNMEWSSSITTADVGIKVRGALTRKTSPIFASYYNCSYHVNNCRNFPEKSSLQFSRKLWPSLHYLEVHFDHVFLGKSPNIKNYLESSTIRSQTE